MSERQVVDASEAEIRALIEDRVNAVRAKDAAAAVNHFAPDVVAFDVVGPLQYLGSEALQKRAADLLRDVGLKLPPGRSSARLSRQAGKTPKKMPVTIERASVKVRTRRFGLTLSTASTCKNEAAA